MRFKIRSYIAIFFSLNVLSPDVQASSQTVSDPDIDAPNGLRNAILNISTATPDPTNSITFTLGANTSLTNNTSPAYNPGYNLPPIDIGNANTLTITNLNVIFDGNSLTATQAPFRGLFVNSGIVTLSNFNFSNLKAQGGQGGTGSGGGGGGLGAGGALFVGDGASLSISNVSFSGNSAIGGAGGQAVGTLGGGGGGGLGGQGGNGVNVASNLIGGGGGGLFGYGGQGSPSSHGGSGAGGGGLLGLGGSGAGPTMNIPNLAGGGGGGGAARPTTGNGSAQPSPGTGGNGGNAEDSMGGGTGGGLSNPGATGGFGGGGGGGGWGADGGQGGTYGGGGGGGSVDDSSSSLLAQGGPGGLFGGGGSSGVDSIGIANAAGGAGGYGGGGGGGSGGASSADFNQANGGFGGGGAGAAGFSALSVAASIGGTGGFGAGGGGSTVSNTVTFGGSGGSYGGNGGDLLSGSGAQGSGGGGGGALGGTIFVDQNGKLLWGTNISIATSTITAGIGGTSSFSNGQNGSTAGKNIFLNTNSLLNFQNTDAQTLGSIDGTGSVEMSGSGSMALLGTNTYSGGTIFTAGTLQASSDANLGDTSGTLTFDGGTLELTQSFDTARAVTLDGSGTIETDTSVSSTFSGIFSDGMSAGSLTKSGSGTLALSGANTYTAGTTIDLGTLSLTGSGSLSSTGAVSVNSGTSIFDISGITSSGITIGDLSGVSGSSVTLGGKTLTVGTNTASVTFAGSISGSGGAIVKQGTGTWILSGVNTYSGGTTFTAGTLQASSDANLGNTSGALTFGGGTLELTSSFNSARTVTLDGPGTIETDALVSSTFSGIFSDGMSAGSLTKSGSGTLALSGANTYSGGTILTAGTLRASSDDNLGNTSGALTFDGGILELTSSFDSARTVTLDGPGTIETDALVSSTFSGVFSNGMSAGSLTKSGSGTLALSGANTYSGGTILTAGTLQASSDDNLGNTSGALTFDGGTLELTSSFDSARAVTLDGPGTIETDALVSSTFSGIFSDGMSAGSLTKSGSGTLALSGANTYSGGTIFTAGTLQASSDANLGNTSGALTFGGGTLELTSSFDSARAVTLDGPGTIETDALVSSTFSGIFSDGMSAGSLTKSGSGTLALSGANTYSGGTILTAGTLQASSDANLGDTSGALTFGGGTLELTSSFDSARAVTLDGPGTIETDALVSSTFSGIFSDGMSAGSLTKSGSGTLALSGANTYSGGTILTAGTLQASSDANLGNTSGALTFGGGTLELTSSFNSARTVTLDGPGTIETNALVSSTFSGVFSNGMSAGSLTKSGAGTLALSGANTYSGGTIFTAGTLQASSNANLGDTSGALTFDGGTLELTSSFNSARTVTLDGPGTIETDALVSSTFSGIFSDGMSAGSLTKSGAGTLALSGANTYSGGTTFTAGTLQASSDANLGDTSGALTFDGGTLELTSSFDSARAVTLDGSGTIETDALVSSTFSGIFSDGMSAGSLTKSGAGTLALSGANTYTGGTTIDLGTLSLTGSGSLASTGAVSVNSGTSIFDISGIINSGITIGDLSGVSGSSVTLGSKKLTVGTNTASVTFAGSISDSGGGAIVKQGTGTWILSGANTYTGGTTIDLGALNLTGSGSLASTGAVSVNSGTSIFDISGIISSGTTIGDLSGVSGSRVTLGGKTLTVGTNTASVTFAGSISDSGGGAIVKQGTGTWILSGANTYSGGTTINDGTVALSGTGSLNSSGTVTLSNSGATLNASTLTQPLTIGNLNGVTGSSVVLGSNDFTTNVSTASTFSGTISGTSIVNKGGTGSFTLGTNGILNGSALNVLMGTFICNGLVNAPTTTISSGATLSGTGTLQNVILNGTVAPGSSIGIIHVGNFTFNPGSFYNVELSPSATDEIMASGTVTIDSNATINVFPDPGTYTVDETFTIIDAAGGVSGTFSQVINSMPRLNFVVSYPPNTVVLTIATIPFQEIPLTGNAQAAAGAFGSLLSCCPSSDVLALSTFLDTATLDQLQCDFDSMQPALFNGIPLVQEATTTAIRTTLTDRLQEIHGTACEREIEKNHGLWLVAVGNATKQKSTRKDPACNNGYAGFRGDMQGATLGFDAKPSNHFAMGIGVSATHTDVHWRHKLGKSFTNSFLGSIFSTFYNKYVYLDLTLIGAYDHFDAHRNIHLTSTSVINRTAKHKNHGVEFEGHAGIGLTFNRKLTQIRPFANLDYLYLYQNRYKESGAQSINLRVNGRNAEVLRTEAGLSITACQKSNGSPEDRKRKFECVEEFKLSYVHEQRYQGKHTKSRFVGPPLSSAFSVDGLWPNRDLFSPGFSWMFVFPRQRVSLDLRYNGEFGRGWSNQMGSAEILYRF